MRTTTGARTTNTVILCVLMLFTVFPLLGVFATALQPADRTPLGFEFPWPMHWGNFATAWQTANIPPLIWSSLLIVLGVVPAAIVLAALAGFGLAQARVPGGRALTLLFVAGLTLPAEALISPLYYQMQGFGLLNTRWAIILPLLGLYMPFGVFWMQTQFRSVPDELIEAAEIDGASTWRIFWSIQLPLARAALSALLILFFLWTWNQFLLAIVMTTDPLKRTVAGALGAFQGQYSTNIVLLCAGSLLIIAPSLIVFFIFQRHFIGALLQGSDR
jgi:raffinose/stachyose/melibiose transport system permease protein